MRVARHVLRALILAYRGLVSPWLPHTCRYEPGCSRYALEAVGRYGAWRGGRLAAARLLRCHPWGGWGYDPVPDLAEPEPERHPAGLSSR